MSEVRANREDAFEALIVEHLTANGWIAGDPSEYSRTLGLNPVELVRFVEATQPKEWAKLVGLHGGRSLAVTKFTKRVAAEITARGMVDVLRKGVRDLGATIKLAFFAPAHDLTPELRALSAANRLGVTRQLHHSESAPQDSVDLALFINGLPVATAELKTQFTGQAMADAVAQYRNDRNPNDLIFKERAVVHFAVDQDTVAMTTELAGKSTQFLPFNQGSAGPGHDGGKGNPVNYGGPRTAYLWETVWARDNWLSIFASYVHLETETTTDAKGRKRTTRTTVFPRYHQWDVVEKLLTAAKTEGPGRSKLVQHSAGSGKSNSIAWLAHGLARLHTPNNPLLLDENAVAAGLGANEPVFDKVIIITDRVVLDRQLQATVAGFDHTPGMIETIDKHKTSEDLRAALEGKKARIIVTTLQKFPVVAQAATALAGARFAVIADEAHSSQTGEAVKDLKAVLAGKTGDAALTAAEAADATAESSAADIEDALAASAQTRGKQTNLTFFAFTATPKAKTLEMFGEHTIDAAGNERIVAFHLYSMRQAIEEGFIFDVLANYTTYQTYYRLANGLAGENPVLPKGKAASALARYVSLHPTNLAQKAEIIVEHFRAHTHARIGGRAKAMVVTRSRLHAVRYWQSITSYIKAKGYDGGGDPVRALVAFSGTVFDPQAPNVEYREALLNGFGESQLPKKFGTDEYQVLIVAEKYQTGFDQPLLHTMYVDKRLDGIKAVQTLSRLNRTHPGKDDTFVLDFANDVNTIREAFRPYYAQTVAAPTDPNVLYTLARRIEDANILDAEEVARGVGAILAGGAKGNAELNAAIDPAVDRYELLNDDDQELFRTAVRDFVRIYAFLAQIMPFTDPDLERLYYYGKFLLTRLPAADTGGAIALDGSVILTHLRTELIADQEDISIHDGSTDPLTGPGAGGGTGKQNAPVEELLSELIASINDRFGMGLGDADLVWFRQQEQALADNSEVRVVALNNDIQQFGVYLRPLLDGIIVDRHGANDELFRAYFDKPEFKEMMADYLLRSLYERLRSEPA